MRVYGGRDPITKQRITLREVIPPGPKARREAETVRNRLLLQVAERRNPKSSATIDQLLERYLEQFQGAPNTLDLYRTHVRNHISPCLGSVKVGRLEAEILDSFYAELRRCRRHCSEKRLIDHRVPDEHDCDSRCRLHACKPLTATTIRHIHFIFSGASRRPPMASRRWWMLVPRWFAATWSGKTPDEGHRSADHRHALGGAVNTSQVSSALDGTRAGQEEFYRDLHAHPELSHQERRTAGRVGEWLRRAGYEVHDGLGGTGVVGVLGNGTGPTVLLRADMDALPVREDTGLPYASTVTATDAAGDEVPVAHACGHDVHVACLLGAAQVLGDGRDAWQGTVVALFQPAEETGDGARGMVEDGLAERIPIPDVALAQHVLPFPAGRVGTLAGPVLSAADSMRITVHGRGAHGSMPQSAVDPVVLAAMIVIRLQTIVARETSPGQTAVLTVGSLRAGSKSNVIPDRAVLELNVRTYDDATRTTILDAIRRIVTAECQASGCPREPEFELFDRFPLTINDAGVTERVARAFGEAFGERAGPLEQQTASEDFSDIPTALGVPYTYWGIGGIEPQTYQAAHDAGRVAQDIPVNHSAGFAPVVQPTLDTGTRALVVAALAWLAR